MAVWLKPHASDLCTQASVGWAFGVQVHSIIRPFTDTFDIYQWTAESITLLYSLQDTDAIQAHGRIVEKKSAVHQNSRVDTAESARTRPTADEDTSSNQPLSPQWSWKFTSARSSEPQASRAIREHTGPSIQKTAIIAAPTTKQATQGNLVTPPATPTGLVTGRGAPRTSRLNDESPLASSTHVMDVASTSTKNSPTRSRLRAKSAGMEDGSIRKDVLEVPDYSSLEHRPLQPRMLFSEASRRIDHSVVPNKVAVRGPTPPAPVSRSTRWKGLSKTVRFEDESLPILEQATTLARSDPPTATIAQVAPAAAKPVAIRTGVRGTITSASSQKQGLQPICSAPFVESLSMTSHETQDNNQSLDNARAPSSDVVGASISLPFIQPVLPKQKKSNECLVFRRLCRFARSLVACTF